MTNGTSKNVPFAELEKLGISKEAYENLPEEFRKDLENGNLSSWIKVNIPAANGKTVSIPVRMRIVQDANGGQQVTIAPNRLYVENSLELSPYELERVKSGQVIVKSIMIDGKNSPEFIQLDPATKTLIYTSGAKDLADAQIKQLESVKDIQLGQQQKEAIREGKPVELAVGDQKVTVGVDLKEPEGFKIVKGDMEQWKRVQDEKYDIAHPEYIGLVQTDKNRWEYQQVINEQSPEKVDKDLKQSRNAGPKR